jgi:hypothetical protein
MKHHTDRLFRLAMALLVLTAGPAAQVARADEPAGSAYGREAIEIARGYDDGGGYIWKGSTGVCETLTFDGQTVLEKQPKGTYCCGFTFQVAFKLAQNHGLLDGKSFDEVKRFQVEWYGSTQETAEVQCASAMTNLGVGHAVSHDDALPGDFANFWRTKSGHSVIFLNWVTDDDGNRIGLRYRSSQTKTDGIGDNTEYFKGHGGEVDPDRLYLCRFNEPKADEDETPAATQPRRGANR